MRSILSIIILVSFSLNISARNIISSSDYSDLFYLIHWIDKKELSKNSADMLKSVRRRNITIAELSNIFISDTVYVIHVNDVHNVAYYEMIYSDHDNISYQYQLSTDHCNRQNYEIIDLVLTQIKKHNQFSTKKNKRIKTGSLPVVIYEIIRRRDDSYSFTVYRAQYKYTFDTGWEKEK